jgi:hypothetical protein
MPVCRKVWLRSKAGRGLVLLQVLATESAGTNLLIMPAIDASAVRV